MKITFLQKISVLLLCSFLLLSCKKTLDINIDPSYTTNPTPELLFPSGTMWTAAAVGGNLELLGSIWSQHYAQSLSAQQYRNIDKYLMTNSDTYFTSPWSMMYSGAIPDLDMAIAMAEQQKKWNFWFAANIIKAYTYQILTDMYGNIPFTEADKGVSNLTPKLDDSKTVIYPGIIQLINNALDKINNAKSTSLVSMGNADIIFKGDMNLWEQFAYTLKLKLLMRNSIDSQTAIQAILSSGKLLSADAKVAIFTDAADKSNPLYEQDRRKLNVGTNLRASNTTLIYLQGAGDTRISKFFNYSSGINYLGLDQGTSGATSVTTDNSSVAVLAATDPVYFISLAETQFMVAECEARNNNLANAKTAYDSAMKVAFTRWGLSASTFIAPGGFYELTTGDAQNVALTKILTQKWIASVRCQGWNAFIDINRTGIPKLGTAQVGGSGYISVELVPSPQSSLGTGKYPKRALYPKTSSDYNSSVSDEIKSKTLIDPLWWQQ